ncbi:hypothetical protein AAHA92_32215 [Salvia divinorum]|uniref:F-box protein n=1 Tax=Salvia divinorum TaxID=28513 RepID=A0ABD1FNB6_SALDI
MQTDVWNAIAENLPEPSCLMNKRNLVYVGGDTLFIIDSTCHWFVYDLSSKKEVGKVKVEGQREEDEDECAVVMGAVYAGNNVVESKGGDYVAIVRLSGLLRVGFCSYFYVIADRMSAAEEEKGKEKTIENE